MIHHILMISVKQNNSFSYCDLMVLHHIKWIPVNISVTISASIHVLINYLCEVCRGVLVQPRSFCPAKPGPLRHIHQISNSTNPSQS
jgi:hypothetical protein